MDLTRDEIVTITGGRPHGGEARDPIVVRGFGFDSRTIVAGMGFLALRDARDGHDFVAAAFERGAALAIVERVPDGVTGPLVVVDDTQTALYALARAARARLEPATVIGITGSAGKTSTKDLTAAALASGFAVHASEASFNNEIGLPVTLLAAPEGTEAVVLEMGARFAGNIADLCALGRPAIGVITNIGLAHAEHLGGPAGIAAVKGELLDALPVTGLAVLSAGDDPEHASALRRRSIAPVLTVGTAADADVRVSGVRLDDELRATFRLDTPWGSADAVALAVRGGYQVANAAMAATVALHLGVPLDAVVASLGTATTASWRMELTTTPEGFTILNDSYNASPTSMQAALESFAQLPVRGRRLAVLGEMRELGDVAAAEHARIGGSVADADVDALVVVADLGNPVVAELSAAATARGVEVHDVTDADAAVAIVRKLARPGDAVLVKASRAVGLERVAHLLTDGATEAALEGGRPMIAVLIAVSVAFLVSVLGTPFLIRILKARNIGQQIRDDGPIAHPHEKKAGTPTMGGLAIIVAAFLGYLIAHIRTEAIKFADTAIALWFLILGLAFVGWLDDYLGVRRARNLGLRKRGKTGGILIVTIGFAMLALEFVKVSTHLSFTRELDLDLGTIGWVLWAIIVIYATANAVNITDGLDGLAAGSAALVFAAFVVVAFTQFRHPNAYHLLAAGSIDVAVVAAALMGGCVGFLWWNAPPARVFMGDTGSLALGGAMAGMALLTNVHLLLPLIGGLYVVEIMSVVAQVISFRGFGRRVLRMSPIHHHFEVLGWPEPTILVRFWILAALAMALGLGFFYYDFINIPGIIE